MSQNRRSDWHNSIVGFGIILGSAIGTTVGLILVAAQVLLSAARLVPPPEWSLAR